MHTRRVLSSALLVAALVMLTAAGAFAQAGRGTISGVVIDPSGGVVPLADVVATHQETGVATATKTNDQGLYSLLNLPVGQYTIEFRKEGFTTYTQKGVTVGVQSALTVDAVLSVGGISDTVTVTADAPALETRNAEIGTALKNSVVTNLPLSMTGGRSLENFAYAITPSVEGNNWESNIAGGTPFSKEVILDGASAVIQIQGHISESSPPMEAVEEFRVQTSGIPAEYGRTGGGVFNFSLRSGTNDLHGSVYGQFRHEKLNANTWMNNYLAAANPSEADRYTKPLDRQKLGGASLGGPIFRNRTFYFASFEEYRQTRRQLGNYDRTVPIPAFLDGDFSQLLDRSTVLGVDAGGNPIYKGAIFDPGTGLVFPDNIIPQSRISPISQRIVDIYRQHYQPMIPGRLSNNSAAPAYVDPQFTQHQFSVKADHNFTSDSRLTGSLIWTSRPRTLADAGGIWDPSDDMGGPLSRGRRHEVTTYQGRLSHSQVLSPTMLHVFSGTFNRFRNPSTSGSAQGNWPSELGLAVNGAFGTFPEINFGSDVNGIGITEIGYGISNYYVTNVYQYNDSLSWVKGRHVMKFGGEARFIQMNSHGDRAYLDYNFSNTQTGVQGGPWANQVGFGFASFLLGQVADANLHVPNDLYGRRNYVALFAQDDVRLSDKLTLNLGMRWETTGGWREKYGHWANFNTRAINPVTGALGTLEFADEVDGSFEGPRDWSEFGPRVGLAYQLTNRTVLRGAYGLFYAPIGTNYWGGVPYSFAPGFFGTNTVQPRGDGAAAFDWDETPYPGTFEPPKKDPASTQWGLVSVNPNSLQAGRIQQWNGGVEYELTRDLVVGANYLGNKGTRIASGDLERNQPDTAVMKALLLSGHEWDWVADEASAAAASVPYPYPGFAGSAWMAITPYPQAAAGWGPLFFVGSPLGSTDYHALQLTANKRMSHGIAASMAYTLSRQRGNVDSSFQERWWVGPIQDVTKLDEEAKVIGDQDRTHVLKGYVAWQLPFGNGRRFMNTATGLKNALVSGWTVSTIVRYESGTPIQITSSNSYAGWQYPIYVNRTTAPLNNDFDGSRFNAGNLADPNNQYFNPAAFANPAYGELGKGPGKFAELRGFGGAYEDLGIIKDVRFGHYTAQLNFTLINVFNRHYFGDPETNIASPYFGQVTGMGWQTPRQGQIGLRLQW